MINNDLVEYIKNYIQQGYTKEQIVDFLKQYNYNPQDVSDTADFVQRSTSAEQKIQQEFQPDFQKQETKPQVEQPQQAAPQQPAEKPPSPGKKKIIIIGAIIAAVILIVAVSAFWLMTRPVCGNGIVEEGETADTCCEDVGCIGDQSCTDSMCIDPVCVACQYLENHVCVDYECCANENCNTDKECINNECIPVQCDFCQYAENHSCFDYECCSDADCLPGLVCDQNICIEECGDCQYRVEGVCIEHECCNDTACANDEECEANFCIPLICTSDKVAMNHSCVELDGCASNDECDDSNNNTLDLCIGAGTVTAHCTHMEADVCDSDSDCDDDNITTDDVCFGSPKTCSNTLTDCNDIGDECLPSFGSCDGELYELLDTDYCCVGTCVEGVDLYILSIDDDNDVVEVEVNGVDTVNASETFKIYAFENETRMDTTDGLEYVTLNGQNTTTIFYFNFTMWNITLNETANITLSAVIDYDDVINETNETNNNMTINVSVG